MFVIFQLWRIYSPKFQFIKLPVIAASNVWQNKGNNLDGCEP